MNIRLENDAISERQGGGDSAHGEEKREIPRADHADHTQGHPASDARAPLLAGGQKVPERLCRQCRGFPQFGDDKINFECGFPWYGTTFTDQPALHLGSLGFQNLRCLTDHRSASLPDRRRPRRLRGRRDVCRSIDIRSSRRADHTEHLAGSRFERLDGVTASVDPLAVENLSVPLLMSEQIRHAFLDS